MIKNLTVNRQNDLFLTVDRQKDPPPPHWHSHEGEKEQKHAILASLRGGPKVSPFNLSQIPILDRIKRSD